ncbi:MAG: hypothetical protein ABTQ73_13625 [Caldilineales bacterium]
MNSYLEIRVSGCTIAVTVADTLCQPYSEENAMPYGEIFSGTLRLLWRQKRLLLLSLLGTALTAIGVTIYTGGMMSWYANLIQSMGDPAVLQGDALPDNFANLFVLLLGGMGVMLFLTLVGYVVNLVMRGGVISEAARAWQGEQVQTGRGIRRGTRHALHLFGLDMLWTLPAILVIGGIYVVMIVLIAAPMAAGNGSYANSSLETLGVGGFLLGLCSVLCLAFLYSLFQALVAPLMYQAAVQADRGLGYAIKQGWQLARANLGTMFVFALIVFGISLTVSMVVQAASLPLNAGMMSSMFGAMRQMQTAQPFASGGSTGWVIGVFGTLLLGVVTVLTTAFTQAFTFTLYAEVYRRLTTTMDSASELAEPLAVAES